VGFVGDMREPKGARRMPSLVSALRARRPDWRIVVHCERDNALAPLFAPFRADPGVELVEDRLDDDQLSDLVNSLDVVICPYQRAVYRHGSSGVLSLAAGLGVPCVAPSGTTLAAQIKSVARPLGSVYHGDTDNAVVRAVVELVNRRELNAAEAPAAAARWRRMASGEGLMRNLLQWAGVDVEAVPADRPQP
jgi:hypothetical protein